MAIHAPICRAGEECLATQEAEQELKTFLEYANAFDENDVFPRESRGCWRCCADFSRAFSTPRLVGIERYCSDVGAISLG
jgi:hypothetical protein